MKNLPLLLLFFLFTSLSAQNWPQIKAGIQPSIALSTEFDTAYAQPLRTLGWEDGLSISPDGLHLYCTYAPIDLFSFVLNGDLPNSFSANYLRGAPDFGMDLVSNPIGANEWLHSDILYATRPSLTDSFTTWTLSGMARDFYSEGAPTPFFANDSTLEFMLFTSNDNPTNNTDIWWIQNTTANPVGTGQPLPAPVNTGFIEDNPNLTRLDSLHLVLFFDSENRPGATGGLDIWVCESFDNGASWTNPSPVSNLNTTLTEHQPFLWWDADRSKWFLYYSAYHSDGKPAIFRAEQDSALNWNSWKSPELVVSAGNATGIGEPTVTNQGDLSFVVVMADPDTNSVYDRYDADPWILRKRNPINSVTKPSSQGKIIAWPNPAGGFLQVELPSTGPADFYLRNFQGELLLHLHKRSGSQIHRLDLQGISAGFYLLEVNGEEQNVVLRVLVE